MIGEPQYRQRGNDAQMALRRATMGRVLQALEPGAAANEHMWATILPNIESPEEYARRMMEPARNRLSLWAQHHDAFFAAAFLNRIIVIVWKHREQPHLRADVYLPNFTRHVFFERI